MGVGELAAYSEKLPAGRGSQQSGGRPAKTSRRSGRNSGRPATPLPGAHALPVGPRT